KFIFFCGFCTALWLNRGSRISNYESNDSPLDLHRTARGGRPGRLFQSRQQNFPHRLDLVCGGADSLRHWRDFSTACRRHHSRRPAGFFRHASGQDAEVHAQRRDVGVDHCDAGVAPPKNLGAPNSSSMNQDRDATKLAARRWIPPPLWKGLSVRRGLECSADFQSAVSPNCIRQSVGSVPHSGISNLLAECNSAIQDAIQQSTTLRYDGALNSYPRVKKMGRSEERRVGKECRSGWEPWQ